jgi:hypothetical protein
MKGKIIFVPRMYSPNNSHAAFLMKNVNSALACGLFSCFDYAYCYHLLDGFQTFLLIRILLKMSGTIFYVQRF